MQEIMTAKVRNPRSELKQCACGCHCAKDEQQQADKDGARDAGTFSSGSHCSCVCSDHYETGTGLEGSMRGKE